MAQNSLQDLPATIAKDITGFVPAPVRKLFSSADEATDKLAKKKDTSFHDKAVEEANESFRKAAEKKAAPLTDKKVGQKKKAAGKVKGKGKASQKRSH